MRWMGVWLIRLSPPSLSPPPPPPLHCNRFPQQKLEIMKWMGVWLIPQGWDISPLPPPSASTLRQVSGFPQQKAYSTKRMAVFLILWARDTSPWQITPSSLPLHCDRFPQQKAKSMRESFAYPLTGYWSMRRFPAHFTSTLRPARICHKVRFYIRDFQQQVKK